MCQNKPTESKELEEMISIAVYLFQVNLSEKIYRVCGAAIDVDRTYLLHNIFSENEFVI